MLGNVANEYKIFFRETLHPNIYICCFVYRGSIEKLVIIKIGGIKKCFI